MAHAIKKAAYQKLATDLRESILRGELQPGEKLHGELVLAREHHMSRTTVRLAIKELEKDSLVYRRRGSGTFVTSTPNSAPVTRSVFSNFVRSLANRVSREVRESRWVDAAPEVARELEIPVGSQLLWFQRLDRLDGQPMACDDGWIYAPYAKHLDNDDLLALDFYEHWQRKQGVRIMKNVLEVAALPADPVIAELLEVDTGAPLLMETNSIFTAEHGAARFISYYRHDMYRFRGTYYGTPQR